MRWCLSLATIAQKRDARLDGLISSPHGQAATRFDGSLANLRREISNHFLAATAGGPLGLDNVSGAFAARANSWGRICGASKEKAAFIAGGNTHEAPGVQQVEARAGAAKNPSIYCLYDDLEFGTPSKVDPQRQSC